jgi:excisionase family DNA binding protein
MQKLSIDFPRYTFFEKPQTGSARMTEQRLFDIPSAAKYLQSIGASAVTTITVRTLVSSGKLPHIKIGRRFYITRVAMDSWLANHERRAK